MSIVSRASPNFWNLSDYLSPPTRLPPNCRVTNAYLSNRKLVLLLQHNQFNRFEFDNISVLVWIWTQDQKLQFYHCAILHWPPALHFIFFWIRKITWTWLVRNHFNNDRKLHYTLKCCSVHIRNLETKVEICDLDICKGVWYYCWTR